MKKATEDTDRNGLPEERVVALVAEDGADGEVDDGVAVADRHVDRRRPDEQQPPQRQHDVPVSSVRWVHWRFRQLQPRVGRDY